MKTLAVAMAFCLATVAFLLVALIHPRKTPVPILMYHSVEDEADAPEPSIDVPLFTRQVEYLVAHGYRTVFLREIIDRYPSGPFPADWVALTFDGSDEDFFDNVLPLLRRHSIKATLFVIVSDVGREGSLTWTQLREVAASGLVEIGSHSLTHVPDHCLSADQAWREMAGSKAVLESNLRVPVVSYAYPYGVFSDRGKRMLAAIGYRGAAGTVYRRDEFPRRDVFNLRRVFVSDYSAWPLMFPFMLSGYYVPARGLILRVLNIKTPRDVECPGPTSATSAGTPW